MLADILLPVPFPSFTYEVPEEWDGRVVIGQRVAVELGTKSDYAGVVLRLHNDPTPANIKLKPLLAILDEAPLVSEQQLRFWQWLSSYYMCPLGDIFKAALPGPLKRNVPSPTPRARKTGTPLPTQPPNPLSSAQQVAYDAILQSWDTSDVTLLHGVTSAGKTEIYIHLVERTLRAGKQALYLVPEIALTTQLAERLRRVFGNRMGVYHSKFSDSDRVAIYRRQASPQPYGLILGVRSSVFLPFQQLGLVIVDEEHDPSYKQQEPAPRYHARNAALMLAHQCKAKALLGTATPCIETYARAKGGLYGYVPLTTRFRNLQLPDIEIVDIARLRFQKRMKGVFSPRLVEEMEAALAREEQVILFQNRRGYAALLICDHCGWVPRCTQCDVSLTYHKRAGMLVCHYCGAVYNVPTQCPACHSMDQPTDGSPITRPSRLVTIGTGTERIEEQVARLFPQARTLRMDLDTARTRSAYERIIGDFAAGQADILIGTQMVAKGLDFDRVSLVGVLDADVMLHVPDFRSPERTFHTLAQVAGRAGRKGHKGKVIIQTRSADAPLLTQVANGDYEAMFTQQNEERALFHYPPFTRLINILLRHRDDNVVEHAAQEMGNRLRAHFGERLLGPQAPPVGRVAGLHIRKLLLKVEPEASISGVRQVLYQAQQDLLSKPYAAHINIIFDVDPM